MGCEQAEIGAKHCRPFKVLALVLSLAGHFCLIALSRQEGAAINEANEEVYRPSMRVVEIKLGSSDMRELPANGIYPREKPTVVKGAPSTRQEASVHQEAKASHALLPQAAPYYFATKELTQKPIVIRDVPVDMLLHVPGVPTQAAVLRMLINEYGDVDRIIVENSLLPDSAQEIVIDAFSKIRFHPGEIRGTSVKSQIKIEVVLTDVKSEK